MEGRERGGKHNWSGGSFSFTEHLVLIRLGPEMALDQTTRALAYASTWGLAQAARLKCGSPTHCCVAGSKLLNLSETTQLCVSVTVVFLCKMRLLIITTSWRGCEEHVRWFDYSSFSYMFMVLALEATSIAPSFLGEANKYMRTILTNTTQGGLMETRWSGKASPALRNMGDTIKPRETRDTET